MISITRRAGFTLMAALLVSLLAGCESPPPKVHGDQVTFTPDGSDAVLWTGAGVGMILWALYWARQDGQMHWGAWVLIGIGLFFLVATVPAANARYVTVGPRRVIISNSKIWFVSGLHDIDLANVQRLSYWRKIIPGRRTKVHQYLIFHKQDGTEERIEYESVVRDAAPLIVVRARELGIEIASPELWDLRGPAIAFGDTAVVASNSTSSGGGSLSALAPAPVFERRMYRPTAEPDSAPTAGEDHAVVSAQPQVQAAETTVSANSEPEKPQFDASGNPMGRVPTASLGSPLSSSAELTVGSQVQAQFQDQWWYATVSDLLPDGTVKIHFNDDARSANDRVVRRAILRRS